VAKSGYRPFAEIGELDQYPFGPCEKIVAENQVKEEQSIFVIDPASTHSEKFTEMDSIVKSKLFLSSCTPDVDVQFLSLILSGI